MPENKLQKRKKGLANTSPFLNKNESYHKMFKIQGMNHIAGCLK